MNKLYRLPGLVAVAAAYTPHAAAQSIRGSASAKLPVLVLVAVATAVCGPHAAVAQSVRQSATAYPYDIGGGNVSPPVKIILAILIFGMFFIAFLSLYLRRCLENSSGETNRQLPVVNNRFSRLRFASGLDRSILESFPVILYSDVKDLKIGKGALECAVCITEFSDDERLRFLPQCHHVFHPDCIDSWLASHITCPVCRSDLTKPKLAGDSVLTHELTQSQIEDSRSDQSRSENCDSVQVNEEQLAVDRKFSRSHTTGHSLVSPGEDCERYTLRLPEDVRMEIVTLKRAQSCGSGVDGGSRRGGGRRWNPDRICGGSDLWSLTVKRMPVFIGKSESVGKSDPAQSSTSASLPV